MIFSRTQYTIAIFIFCAIPASFAVCKESMPKSAKKERIQEPTKKSCKEKRAAKKLAKQEKKQKKMTLKNMTYEELKTTKDKHVADNNKELTIKYLEKMLPLCKDMNELKNLMLELADTLFDLGKLEKAEKIYAEFTTFYPGDAKIEYVTYHAILCAFYATLSSDRDQSKTKEAISLTEKFLERADIFKEYEKEVIKIQTECFAKLFESECNIINFYLNRGSLKAVEQRLTLLRKDLLPKLPQQEPIILTLECQLATKQKNNTLAAQKLTELNSKFPEYKTIKLAQNKKSFAHRF